MPFFNLLVIIMLIMMILFRYNNANPRPVHLM